MRSPAFARCRPAAALAVATLLAACGRSGGDDGGAARSGEDAGPSIADAVVEGTFRGMAIVDVEGRARFEPCGSVAVEALALVDSAGGDLAGAYQELVGEPGGPLYVEVRGRVEPAERGALSTQPARRLVVLEIRRASLQPQGCEEMLDGVVFRAMGNEPFWSVDVTPFELTLQRPGEPSIMFPFSAPRDSAGSTVYQTRAPDGPGLRLVITEERCTDSMSGFWFAYSARAVIGEETVTGCAAEGW